MAAVLNPGDAVQLCVELVLEQEMGQAPSQEVGKAPSQAMAFLPKDLEILRGFAKMSLRRKIGFLTCDI